MIGPGSLQQSLLGADIVLCQQFDGLCHGIALRDRDPHGLGIHVARRAAHSRDKGVIVHIGIQFIGAHADLILGVGQSGKGLEEPFILDEPGIAELIGDRGHGIIRRDLHRYFHRRAPVEGTQVAHQQPAYTRQNGGGHQHKQDISQWIDPFAAPPAGGCMVRLLAAAHLLRIPTGGISSFIIRHWNLHILRPDAVRRYEFRFCVF